MSSFLKFSPYQYYFSEKFFPLRQFQTLRLLISGKIHPPTLIPYPTAIRETRVCPIFDGSVNRIKKIEKFVKNAHIEIPFEKNRTDTLVGPNETEKIDTAVLTAIILSFYITQRGGLTDKAVVCDAGGPWYESTCDHNFFSPFFSLFWLNRLLFCTLFSRKQACKSSPKP